MTDKIDTSTLGRIDLTSGSSPAPIEECVSTWAVDDEVVAVLEAHIASLDAHGVGNTARLSYDDLCALLTLLKDSSK